VGSCCSLPVSTDLEFYPSDAWRCMQCAAVTEYYFGGLGAGAVPSVPSPKFSSRLSRLLPLQHVMAGAIALCFSRFVSELFFLCCNRLQSYFVVVTCLSSLHLAWLQYCEYCVDDTRFFQILYCNSEVPCLAPWSGSWAAQEGLPHFSIRWLHSARSLREDVIFCSIWKFQRFRRLLVS
jgi:hypothetical protein